MCYHCIVHMGVCEYVHVKPRTFIQNVCQFCMCGISNRGENVIKFSEFNNFLYVITRAVYSLYVIGILVFCHFQKFRYFETVIVSPPLKWWKAIYLITFIWIHIDVLLQVVTYDKQTVCKQSDIQKWHLSFDNPY